MNETKYRAYLEKTIKKILPGPVFILRNNPKEYQGIPDIIVLCGQRWAILEIKEDIDADHQPNQEYYIAFFGQMSFSSFIYPQNEVEVLDGLIDFFNQN